MSTDALSHSADIMDVTVRDGSYVIDFQWSADETAAIAQALERCGVRWIEVGHGLGFNASDAGKGRAAASDEAYLEATAAALTRAKWGAFIIPGIGRTQDLLTAARYGISFVRVGCNITELDLTQPYIELAKELGLFVSFNGMKSYAVPPSEFGRCAARAQRFGADIVYLVDSAGGMFPEEIRSYFQAVRDQTDVPLGFHGHNNLGLAIANTLTALDCGAALVDSSLQGMGRSAGNAVTEMLVAIMQRKGLIDGIDLKAVMDVGTQHVQPRLSSKIVDPIAVITGFAKFHSSFFSKVSRYASEYDLDVRDLIVRLCEVDMVNAPDALLKRLSEELAVARGAVDTTVEGF